MSFNYTLDRSNTYTDNGSVALPVDVAYVCEIKGVKEVDETYGDYRKHELQFAIDIIEGEFAGYYQQRFNADNSDNPKWKGVVKLPIPKGDGTERDGWTIKAFNTALCNIEDSNAGYTWDNNLDHLKGKKIGLVLRSREYEIDGRKGFYSEPFKLISVKNAQDQKFRKPATKYLQGNNSSSTTEAEGFVPITDAVNDEIPFQ